MKSNCCALFTAIYILWLRGFLLPNAAVAGDAKEYATRTVIKAFP